MKIENHFDESGKTFQEIIEQFLIFYYNDTVIKQG